MSIRYPTKKQRIINARRGARKWGANAINCVGKGWPEKAALCAKIAAHCFNEMQSLSNEG